MAVNPSDAATVMLLRPCRAEGGKGIEVLLVLRNRKSSFVPGYYVFPGGKIDQEDCEPGMERLCRGIDRQKAASILQDMSHADKALGAWIAGIRETFEEVGLLIARRKDGSSVAFEADGDRRRFERYRQALIQGEMNFSSILEAEDLVLQGDDLHYYSHWITPEQLPLRYDVRFFVTPFPAGQSVSHDGVELTNHVWLRPAAALKNYETGEIGMVLPQIVTLQELSRFKTVEEVIESAQKRHVQATLTRMVQMDDKYVEVMPDGTVFHHRPPVYSWPDKQD